jgi:hypothetical protein
MLKFFRHIRKKLLGENRLTKYLIYAIGEIVLVVIGILFALQINSWNEALKNKNKEVYILKELKKEFQNDSIKLQSFIQLVSFKTASGNRLKKAIIQKEQVPIDSLIYASFFNGRLVLFESNTPTYDELVSTGRLDLLKNESLKKLINDFKNHLKIEKTFFSFEAQNRKEAYNQHLFKYFEPQIMGVLWERKKVEDWNTFLIDPQGYLNDPLTLFHVNVAIGVDRELTWKYSQRTIWRITSIIESITKELKLKQ